MTENPQPVSRGTSPAVSHLVAWAFLFLVILAVGASAIFQMVRSRAVPPVPAVYGNAPVPAFSLDSARGGKAGSATLAGAPYIIDFIFTRCAGQCPMMTQRMKGVQDWLAVDGHKDVKLVSVTVDPAYDTTATMAAFADRFGADPDRWLFLTGERAPIYSLIKDGFKLGVDDEPASGTASKEEPIIHSNRFVLVDAAGYIRGYYVGLDPDDLLRLRRDLPQVIRAHASPADAK